TAVFECEDPRGRRVAAKALLSLADATAVRRKRLEAEVRALARLSHPGIVRVHGASNENGMPYFVMDLVPGATLAARLRERGTFDVLEAARVIACAADAMAHAHERGVLHRDLTPANILADGPLATAQPVIVGFGVAKVAGFETRATRPGEIVGTPTYTAPEVIRAELGPAGPPLDVYALGAILFELLTGRPPFQAGSVGELVVKILDERPPTIDGLRRAVPPGVVVAVERALAKKPGDRFANASELAAALRRDLPPPAQRREGRGGGPTVTSSAPHPNPPPVSRGEGVRAAVAVLVLQLPLLVGLVLERARQTRLAVHGGELDQAARALADRAETYARARDRALLLVASDDTDAAIAALGSAQATRPDWPEPAALRASVESRAGLVDQARADATRALELAARRDTSPEAREALELALVARSSAALSAGDPGAALADLDRAIEAGATPELHARRARVRALLDRRADAEDDLARAAAAPAAARALARAAILARSGALDQAIAALDEARDRDPLDSDLRAARAALLLDAGRTSDALLELEPLRKKNPRSGPLLLLLARASAAAGLWTRALGLRESARLLGRRDAELDRRLDAVEGLAPPRNPDETAGLASHLVELGRAGEARTLLLAELARSPALALERSLLEATHALKLAEALVLADELATADGPASFHRARAEVLALSSRLPAAEEAATRAIERDPLGPESFLVRARVRLDLAFAEWSSAARFEAAASDARRALELETRETGEALFVLGAARLVLGDTAAAMTDLARARREGVARAEPFLAVGRTAVPSPEPRDDNHGPLASVERAREDARELGDDERWEVAAGSFALPSFDRIAGKASLLVSFEQKGSVAFPDVAWRASTVEKRSWPASVDLGRTLRVALAARGEGEALRVSIVLRDEAGAERTLVARTPLRIDGSWNTLRVPLAGDAEWQATGKELDSSRVARIAIALEGQAGKRFACWIDGLGPDGPS
ncbi:MAG TPA: serine/threonine-protein kinase, partial [Planctomycetota bacterium]|nr:serine/threonine-protein kinase [Planctomycetota bacterium]